ncbi:MAG: thioredoxin family protein [Mangrovibacterium sp.]
MRRLYIIVCMLFAGLSMPALAQINFEHGTLDEAIAKAKKENKVVFIDGWAVWCGPCKHMANTVFMDKEVGEYFDENLIAIKIDVERGEGPAVKRKYGITGLPGYVFLDGDGLVVYRFQAAMPKEKFMDKVELAVSYAKDQNSVGRLAERYETEKDNEEFVLMYLNKLAETKSTGYTDVLEHYLAIQTSMEESSKEMVMLLSNSYEEIIFNGKADEIFQRNNGSDAWKLYVRRDVRENFQKLPKHMLEKTTDYAIAHKDTSILEMAYARAMEDGLIKGGEEQHRRTYIYYYLATENGERFKSMVHDEYEAAIAATDKEKLLAGYRKNQEERAAGDLVALASKPFAVRTSLSISSMVESYAKFVETEQEKADVVRWMEVAYYVQPDVPSIMSRYAAVLYQFSDRKAEAIGIQEEALRIAKEANDKHHVEYEYQLNEMKAGEEIEF